MNQVGTRPSPVPGGNVTWLHVLRERDVLSHLVGTHPTVNKFGLICVGTLLRISFTDQLNENSNASFSRKRLFKNRMLKIKTIEKFYILFNQLFV